MTPSGDINIEQQFTSLPHTNWSQEMRFFVALYTLLKIYWHSL